MRPASAGRLPPSHVRVPLRRAKSDRAPLALRLGEVDHGDVVAVRKDPGAVTTPAGHRLGGPVVQDPGPETDPAAPRTQTPDADRHAQPPVPGAGVGAQPRA